MDYFKCLDEVDLSIRRSLVIEDKVEADIIIAALEDWLYFISEQRVNYVFIYNEFLYSPDSQIDIGQLSMKCAGTPKEFQRRTKIYEKIARRLLDEDVYCLKYNELVKTLNCEVPIYWELTALCEGHKIQFRCTPNGQYNELVRMGWTSTDKALDYIVNAHKNEIKSIRKKRFLIF